MTPSTIATLLSLYNPQSVECIAEAVYFEARGEPTMGQEAVAHVILNRTASPKFPNDPCEVVRYKIGKRCAFSYYCDGKAETIRDPDAWRLAVVTTLMALTYEDPTQGALFYHATWIDAPRWTSGLTYTMRIGDHIFYREGE